MHSVTMLSGTLKKICDTPAHVGAGDTTAHLRASSAAHRMLLCNQVPRTGHRALSAGQARSSYTLHVSSQSRTPARTRSTSLATRQATSRGKRVGEEQIVG